MHSIGVPKESKRLEKRVGLTPQGVRTLTSTGFDVFVEKDAGIESGFLDFDYQRSGARICDDAKELYQLAELIIKVKEPQPAEYAYLEKKHTLFCFLHLASQESCDCVKALCESGATAIGYETLETDGGLPLLKPMSEIAGGLSFSYGSFLLSKPQAFQGDAGSLVKDLFKIASEYPKLPECHRTLSQVIVWGGGIAGEAVLKMALQMKNTQVALIEPRLERRAELERLYGKQMKVKFLSPNELSEADLQKSNLWIGCVHSKGDRAMQVVGEDLLEKVSRKQKKVIMDISIDQGGNFPQSKTTYYNAPIFLDTFGNQRFCVANIPSFCGAYASGALEKIALPFIEFLAYGVESALSRNEALRHAVNVKDHKVMIDEIKQAHKLG